MKKIGIIGMGGRMLSLILNEFGFYPELQIVAVTDIDLAAAKDRLNKVNSLDIETVHFYENTEEMFSNEQLDGVFVATRCDLHKTYAMEVLKRNIPLFLEKPVVTTLEDYYELKQMVETSGGVGVTSFPLRLTAILQKVKEIYDSGALGTLSQVQAYNNVSYGRVYYKNWYRDESITGGLFLQKATHDLDYINYVLGQQPVEICAMESKMVYKGDKPADLKCEDCPEQETCYESTKVIREVAKDEPQGEYCSYGKDVGNHDSATILMQYADGLHAVYTQNFVARKKAAKRGMRLIGQKATVEFDWVTNEIQLFSHDDFKVERTMVYPESCGGHGGGDYALIRDFVAILNGDTFRSSLQDGLQSAYLCLKAKESAEKRQFIKV
ncbi:MAG: Gfo/Idh/MocA family oxidoreductase [Clostridia bacterium]|nr:Gfo/Idh/MocA family oxidoreductase [Clostridia bacterium]